MCSALCEEKEFNEKMGMKVLNQHFIKKIGQNTFRSKKNLGKQKLSLKTCLALKHFRCTKNFCKKNRFWDKKKYSASETLVSKHISSCKKLLVRQFLFYKLCVGKIFWVLKKMLKKIVCQIWILVPKRIIALCSPIPKSNLQ